MFFLCSNWNFRVPERLQDVTGPYSVGLFKKQWTPTLPVDRSFINMTTDRSNDDIQMLNTFLQIALMLAVDSERPWSGKILGVTIDPVTGSFFRLDVWWEKPTKTEEEMLQFEQAFKAELSAIADAEESDFNLWNYDI